VLHLDPGKPYLLPRRVDEGRRDGEGQLEAASAAETTSV
jgi:hypothetical protein